MTWYAQLWISKDDKGIYHVYAHTGGSGKNEALKGARFIIEKLAEGKLTFVRNLPEADSYTDFDTKEVCHRGFVRFSFKDEPGPTHWPDPVDTIFGFGDLSERTPSTKTDS